MRISGQGEAARSGPAPSRRASLALLLFLTLVAGCDLFGAAEDDRSPNVRILRPGMDAVVAGQYVRIVIEAEAHGSDNYVSFTNVLLNGEKAGEAHKEGEFFVFTLDSRLFDDGEYRLEAAAFDRSLARGASAPVLLMIENRSPGDGPVLNIIAPDSEEEVTGLVRIVARTTPSTNLVDRVELLVDGAPVLQTTEPAGPETYTFDLNTSEMLAGRHAVEIKAFSPDGSFHVSPAIFLNVFLNDDPDGRAKPGTVAWRAAGFSGEVKGSVAVGFNNDVYVASSSDTLYAFSPLGELKWKFATRGPVRSSPLVGNNEDVFVASEDGRLYGLDAEGHELWPAYQTGSALRSSPAMGVEGLVFFGDSDGRVHAVNSFNGLSAGGNWPVAIGTSVVAPPVIAADRTVYVAGTDGHLYALSHEGALRWRSAQAIGTVSVGMALVEKVEEVLLPTGATESRILNVIYAVSEAGKIWSLSGRDGIVRWSENLDGPLRSSPVVGADGTVYTGTSTGLVALNDEIDGFTPRLRFTFVAADVGTPAIDSGDVLYFVSGRRVHAINPNNTPVWDFDVGAEADAPLTITRTGLLLAAGRNGVLTALETGSVGLSPEAWPMFQRNARHTGRVGIDARD